MIYTYKDAVEDGMDFLGGSGDKDRKDAIRAIRDAYQELSNIRRWHYYYGQYRLNTVASYSTGTIDYDHTGGAAERLLTLASGTWPTWAAFGTVVIDSVQYQVATREGNTALTLSVNSNPGANVDAGTSYTIYRSIYPLPTDFVATDQLSAWGSSISCPTYVHPTQWLQPQFLNQEPGTPRFYTVMSDPNYMNALAVAFSPPPIAVIRYDAIYQRRPRPLNLVEYSTGTVTAASGGASVVGTSTAWASGKHQGAIIRFGADGTNAPTGFSGLYPAEAERTVSVVTSTTAITVDSDFDSTLTAVKYIISDPVDIEDGAMLTAFRRCVELQLCRARRMKDVSNAQTSFGLALQMAFEADSRSFASRRTGHSSGYSLSMTDFPMGDDE